MPISPEKMKLYPGGSIHSKEWKAIRHGVLQRSKRRFTTCECRGECGCTKCGMGRCGAVNGLPHPITESKVVLTIAHLDHNPQNNHFSNLRAMCQRCHNRYDAKHRLENRRKKND